MPQPSDGVMGGELCQPVVMIGGTPLDQLLEMFDAQALDADSLSRHLPEVWEWQNFWAVDRFLEQNAGLPAEQLEQVKVATGYKSLREGYQQYFTDPEGALEEIQQIRRKFMAEFGPGADEL